MGGWRFALGGVLAPLSCNGHGHMTYPPSSRHGGSIAHGGDCAKSSGACYWFTNNQPIPGEPVLPSWIRSVNGDISSGDLDWSRTNPWRAPGTTPVLGSGCGVAGGGPVPYANGGTPPEGIEQGADGLILPKQTPTVWQRGTVQEVGNSVSANHAGGYSWRLCKADGDVNEECFQRNVLNFIGNNHFLVFIDGNWTEIPRAMVDQGTHPAGSQWARWPIPSCLDCNPAEVCGPILEPEPGLNYKSAWNQQVNCNGECAGSRSSKRSGSCPGATQFPAPMEGMSGFGKSIFRFSVVDQVMVPADLEPGEYLLSWRWDCEQSDQVFQNCADIVITDDSTNALDSLVSDLNAKTTVYHAVGADGCKDQLYENECQDGQGDDSDSEKDKDSCLPMQEADCKSSSVCSWIEKNGKNYCARAVADSKAEREPEPESEPEADPEPQPATSVEISTPTNDSTDMSSGVASVGMVVHIPLSLLSFLIVLCC